MHPMHPLRLVCPTPLHMAHAGEAALFGESSSSNQAAPRYLVLDWQPEAFRDDQALALALALTLTLILTLTL